MSRLMMKRCPKWNFFCDPRVSCIDCKTVYGMEEPVKDEHIKDSYTYTTEYSNATREAKLKHFRDILREGKVKF